MDASVFKPQLLQLIQYYLTVSSGEILLPLFDGSKFDQDTLWTFQKKCDGMGDTLGYLICHVMRMVPENELKVAKRRGWNV